MQNEFDLAVIGAGPGGYVAAIRGAQSGMKVALIEEREIGGTCLNRGCVPTKALMHSANLYRQISRSDLFGIEATDLKYDMEKIYSRKDEVVSKLRSGVEFLISANQIEIIRSRGLITDQNTIKTKDREIKAKNILIATGSSPARPPIPGLDLPGVMTSDELLNQQQGPGCQSLIIIGGGVIGMEFAGIFSSFGCKVTVIEAMDRILSTMDREIAQNLSMIMRRRGVTINTRARVNKIEQTEEGLICHYTQKETSKVAEAQAVLVAIGRKPNVDGLFSENLNIKTERGIVVNEHFQTNIPSIYAIGDVISDGIQLAHLASAQGITAVSHMIGNPSPVDLNTIPSCIYTEPEIASVGLSADQAKAQGLSIKTGKFPMSGNAKSIIEDEDRGFIKLVFDSETEVILGAQMMCGRATDLISEMSTAIVDKLTLADLGSVIRPHPTFIEGISEALDDTHGKAIHIAPRNR